MSTKPTAQYIADLERKASKLDALEQGGVDNWEFYSASLEAWNRENRIDELKEEFIDSLEVIFGQCAYEPSERGAGVAFHEDSRADVHRLMTKLKVSFEDVDEDM